jgi:hypothetical protein
MERGGKHEIKIQQGERRNKRILLVDFAEMERPYPLSVHQQDSGQDHSQQ